MKRIAIITTAMMMLSSCATEKNISLNDAYWQQKHKVAVADTKPAQPGVTTVGSQGILDLAINSAMTNTLDKQVRKTDIGWYYAMPNDLAQKLKARKVRAVAAEGLSQSDDKAIASLAAKYNVDDVLVMHLYAAGIVRSYAGFIPTSAPEAYCVLKGELVDSSNKSVKWRHLTEIKLPVQGNWDQPPAYPNVTLAVNQAIKLCRQEVLDSLFSGH